MRRALLLGMVWLAGCRQLLGLHDLDADAHAPDSPIATDSPPIDAPPDMDHDGVADGSDNCPTVANPDQADEDADGHGDVCDNCPGEANADQADDDNDGVGDVCDPHPNATGDHLVLFLGFNAASDLAGWTMGGNDITASVFGGQLTLDDPDDLGILWNNDVGELTGTVSTRAHYNADRVGKYNSAGLLVRFARAQVNDFGTGIGCGDATAGSAGGPIYPAPWQFDNGVFSAAGNASLAGSASVGRVAVYKVTVTTLGQKASAGCTVGSASFDGFVADEAGSGVSFAVDEATAAFDYLEVIE